MTKRAPIYFILVTVVLDTMGIGLILPVMPSLLMEVRGADLAQAAWWGGVLAASFGVMQFLFAPAIGNLSDRFGRRPILLISLFVMCMDYIVMALAGSIWLLLAARMVGGVAAATHSTAAAYMADISPPEKKSQNFGLISACFGIGFVFGPVIGGLLAELGPRAPFVAAAVLSGANFLFGWFVLPETVKPENRRPFVLRRANPLAGLKYIGGIQGVGLLLAVYFFYQIANMVYPAVWAYFTQASFGWNPGMVGISLAVYGIATAVVMGGLIRIVIPWLGEARTVYVGLAFNVVMLMIIAFVPTGTLLLMLTPLAALGALVAPALQAVMSQRAADNQQGELQGVLSSLNALGMIFAQLAMTRVFYAFTADTSPVYLPGAPFIAASVLMATAFTIYAISLRVTSREPV